MSTLAGATTEAGTIVECVKLCKQFGQLQASVDVSLTLRKGEIHALIGPNGAGKSTLIQQISGELASDSGHVFIDQLDVTNQGAAARASKGLARTFQVSALALEDSVMQNVLLGSLAGLNQPLSLFRQIKLNSALRDHAEAALQMVGLDSLADKRAAELSHGQRRQLEIAIALTLKPRAFIMDEPMAGLGASGTSDLTDLLDRLRQQAPLLLVEHDMDAVFKLADRVSVLVSGRIIATGTGDEIRQNPQVRRAYLGDDR